VPNHNHHGHGHQHYHHNHCHGPTFAPSPSPAPVPHHIYYHHPPVTTAPDDSWLEIERLQAAVEDLRAGLQALKRNHEVTKGVVEQMRRQLNNLNILEVDEHVS